MLSLSRCNSTHRLPKTKENHQLDGKNLEERRMLLDVIFDLDIELDETVHCDSDRSTLNNQDLYGSS